jgi:hypothetical protein
MTITSPDPQTIPDFSDPRTFAAEVPHDAFDKIRAADSLYWQPAKGNLKNGGFWVMTRHARSGISADWRRP